MLVPNVQAFLSKQITQHAERDDPIAGLIACDDHHGHLRFKVSEWLCHCWLVMRLPHPQWLAPMCDNVPTWVGSRRGFPAEPVQRRDSRTQGQQANIVRNQGAHAAILNLPN
ncbi:hypothetical protein TPL01_31030 [Sulfuriferula plumbiphila]|uniref:Uncharacterized protein n=1 Tax=Sulfuriferula plumbiphila TaxID=171865 RepID=A0A512LBU7_9PROT|nr:hypothetical protein SFPGR_15420 [Sulfuriferula plumbiphila]GEP31965.1 hypothetical protein TPL01_31030 [Sulfuriferula plumbiphila]